MMEIPTDLLPFVQSLIASKRFLNGEDVIAEGLRLLQIREALRDDVRKGFEQLESGRTTPANQTYERVEQLILE